ILVAGLQATPTAPEPALAFSSADRSDAGALPPAQALATEPSLAAILGDLEKEPCDVEALHRFYRALKRSADVDRRFCTAQALVYLNAADAEERATYDAGRTGVLIQPVRALTGDEWRDFVADPDHEPLVGDILGEIAPAVLLARLARPGGAASGFDPSLQLDL